MSLYFMLHDRELFEGTMRPALAASRRTSSFLPCQQLCKLLVPTAEHFGREFHTAVENSILMKVVHGLAFDRSFWKLLVGEMLLFAATEIPEIQTDPEMLGRLLDTNSNDRQQASLIEQAHFGAGPLVFGACAYRPGNAGYNDPKDIEHLATYLESIDSNGWTVEQVCYQKEEFDEVEGQEELAFARQCLMAL
jgi:hypothetical protein